MAVNFKLQIGAKRQVTLPEQLLKLLSIAERGEIQITVEHGVATIVPMVSLPRHLVSESLLQEMEARRGPRRSDLPLAQFLKETEGASQRRSVSVAEIKQNALDLAAKKKIKPILGEHASGSKVTSRKNATAEN